MDKIETRNALAQQNFDYRLWHTENMPEYAILNKLYDAGFTRSEARKALTFIYNQTEKALNS